MFTGREALGSIDVALHKAQSRVQEAEQSITATTQRLLDLEREEIGLFRALARIRVDLLASGEIVTHLDRSEQRALQILETRDQARQQLNAELTASQQRQMALERARVDQEKRVDTAEKQLDLGVAETQQRLQADGTYQQQLAAAQQAERVAQHAEEKTELALDDRRKKGEPYEQDPLFIYLWRRGYGTSEYHANPLTAYLDDWVARLCGYGDARANYAMLTNIPRRLQEHAEQVRAAAKTEFERLEQLEHSAADADGIPARQQALTTTREALQQLDDELAAQQQSHRELLQRNDQFSAGEDHYFTQAIEQLTAELRRDDIRELHRDARLTPTPDDDRVIDRIVELIEEKARISEDLAQHRTLLRAHRERLNELESLRLEFKRERYDGTSSVFADGTLVGMMLNEFLKGVLSRDGLWREIRRQHRQHTTHSSPDFGSGGFSRRGSGWGGSGGFGSGGGGFKTGGGF